MTTRSVFRAVREQRADHADRSAVDQHELAQPREPDPEVAVDLEPAFGALDLDPADGRSLVGKHRERSDRHHVADPDLAAVTDRQRPFATEADVEDARHDPARTAAGNVDQTH